MNTPADNTPNGHLSASLQALCRELPPSPIDAVGIGSAPGAVMRPRDVLDIARKAKLGTFAELLAEQSSSTENFITALLEADELQNVMTYLCYAMPRREGLWWAWRCSLDALLDRHRAQSRAEPTGGVSDAQSTAPPVGEVEPKPRALPLDLIEKNQATAEAGTQAAVSEFSQRLKGIVEPHLQALAPDAKTQAIKAIADKGLAMRVNIAQALPKKRKQVRIVPAGAPGSPVPRPGSSKGPPQPPEAASPEVKALWLKARRLDTERELRCLAVALQWIVHPCQDHAEQGRVAAAVIRTDGPAKALAKATFWCGEDLNTTKKKPQVAPPPTLPRKGIAATLTKAINLKGGTWSQKDRIHWFLTRGLDAATGRSNWDGALEEFELYGAYCREVNRTA